MSEMKNLDLHNEMKNIQNGNCVNNNERFHYTISTHTDQRDIVFKSKRKIV